MGVSAQTGGYGKVVSHVIIGLKTVKGTKQLKLDPTIYDSLQKEKVRHSRKPCAHRKPVTLRPSLLHSRARALRMERPLPSNHRTNATRSCHTHSNDPRAIAGWACHPSRWRWGT